MNASSPTRMDFHGISLSDPAKTISPCKVITKLEKNNDCGFCGSNTVPPDCFIITEVNFSLALSRIWLAVSGFRDSRRSYP